VADARNTRLIAHIDCPGGGQVWVDGTTLYIGHMRAPSGTTIVDVADPRAPKIIAHVELPQGWHSHKVRAQNGLMIVNHEKLGTEGDPTFGGGLGIYDVSNPSRPREVAKWRTGGRGVHRYDFDGRYAYISPTADGYVGNIVMILDLADPARPQEVGRWWIPGQWEAGGEDYPWRDWVPPRCHHPIRMGFGFTGAKRGIPEVEVGFASSAIVYSSVERPRCANRPEGRRCRKRMIKPRTASLP
jgi:hypothetical protein